MKITKQQLKKIIEEELESSLGEDNIEESNVIDYTTGDADAPERAIGPSWLKDFTRQIAGEIKKALEPLEDRLDRLEGRPSE